MAIEYTPSEASRYKKQAFYFCDLSLSAINILYVSDR